MEATVSSPRSVVSQPTRTRTHWRRALILAASVLWCAFLGAPRLEAASTIGTVTASPTEIAAGTRTVVTVTTGIVDASVIPGSIRLLETDARGKALKLLGFLRDDGTAGDQTAGDRIYTMRLVVREPRATQRFLRVVATFRNEPARVGSALIRLIIQRRTVPRKLEPNPLTMAVGAVGTLTATLAPPPLTPGTLVISSRNPRIASVPAGVAFAAGQTKVQIPISALSRGTATIVASLSGRRATATVRVRTGALRVIELAPPAIALTTGATGELTVRLSAVAPVDTVVNMSSSNPAVAAVPATATVPAGRMDSTVRVEGVTPGVAQIRARLNGSSAASQVTVTPAPPSVVSLLPPVSNLTVGASGTLQVTISSAQVEPTVVSITTTPPGIVSAPASVTIPPGQVTASLSVDAIALGQAGVTARLGDSSAAALVNVTEPPVAITALQPESVSLIVGATIPFTVQINTARSDETDIDLVSSVPGVLDVPDSVTIEAGQTSATFVATALAAGDAALTASVDGSSRQSAVRVAPQPAAVVSLVPSPLPLQEGATGLLRLTINAAQENDTVVALTNSAPAVAQVPAAVTVPSGALSVDVPVTGLTAGQSSVTASVNGTAVSASIVVSAPPPVVTALSPTTQQLPQGVAGTLRVTLSRGSTEPARVALSSSDGGVATVPVEVTVPAGSLFADFPVATVGVGNTTITASLNSATVLAQVTVTAAEPVSLAISPVTPSVSVGATVAFTATATLTDGTSANLTASSLWSSSTPTVASIDAAGTATALTPGETTVEARHTFTPVQTGQPVTLLAETLLSVTSPATLSLSADATEVALGESLLITLNATDVAPEGGLLVTLAASGTGAATLPTNVTIAAGDSSATFSLTGTAAGDVTVSASASGYVSASLPIAVRAPLRIDALEPTSGPVGASVAMIGGGFDTALAGNVVDFPTADTARVPGTVLSATATRLVVRVPPTAESGPIRIANARGTASSPAFSVTREQDFQVVVSPGTVTVYQGATGLTQVQLSSTGTAPFTALVRLSAEGLPAGVSARFIPAAAITGNQTVAMELVAPAGTPAGLANVRVRGELVESGQTLVRRGELDLLVQSAAGVTGAKGRFVTPARIGIAGVIVRVDTPSGPIQTTSDAAGSFQIVGIPAGEISLRFDATPANPFYPIWPYTVTLPVNQVTVFPDWTINPPPPNERFTPIANATQDQVITDPRFPGLAIRLPAGVTITGWDGVLKTRIAVERVEISKLPVPPPPTPTGSAYQLYFGTPMGGIPSAPIPVTLPNDVGGEPGEAIDVWYFDGSPMARSGEWRIAGTAIVSADGRSATMLPGTGVPRFCGVCGLVCLGKQPEGPHPFCPATAGNAIEPFTGQALPSTGGLTCGGLTPIETGMNYNPVDAYGNIGGTSASLGFGWTLDYDVGFLPFVGPQKRLLLPGNRRVNVIDDGTGNYRPFDDPRLDGAVIRATNLAANEWELTFRDQTRWRFRPFSTIFVRGGPPTFLTEIVDPQGNVLPIQRRADGRVTSVGSQARGVTMTYGANGFVSEIRDSAARTTQYAYTADDRLETVTDPDGRVTRYTYVGDEEFPVPAACPAQPSFGRRLKTIQYPGRPDPTVNDYGPGRRVLRQVAYDGLEYRFSYQVTGACVVNVSAPNVPCQGLQCPNVDSWENLQAGWRIYGGVVTATTVTRPDGQRYTNEFNARGMTVARTDEQGQRTTLALDSGNRLTQRTDPLGRQWRYEYDARGNRITSIDPLGRIVRYTYDPQWNLVTSITRFDESNQPQNWQFTYDADRGTLLSATNPLGETTRMSYTARGELETVTSALDQVTRFVYSAAGDLDQVADPLGNVVRFGQDGAGRGVAETLPLGSETRWEYDGSDRLTTTTDALGQPTRLTYDPAGRLQAVINARSSQIESYAYDSGDRLVARTDALGRSTAYDYDAAGRLTSETDRRGNATDYGYDGRGRVISITRPEGVTRIAYDSVGRVIEITEPTGSLTYTYDAADRLTREVQTTGEMRTEVTYGYDALDRRVSRTVSGVLGETTLYAYDRANRLRAITYRGESTTFTYDGVGRLVQKALPNGIRQEYAYDNADRLTSIISRNPDASVVDSIAYGYDANGRRVSRSTAGATLPDMPFTAEYDAADRMTSITFTDSGQTFDLQYDANGNLASKIQRGAPANVTSYSWDSRNRLIAINAPGVIASFAYDPLGRRVARSVNGQLVTYVYDGQQAVGEISAGETVGLLTGLGLDDVIARYSPAGARYYLTDALNSVVALSTAGGAVQNRYAYSPYGQVASSGLDGGNSIRYTAREDDGTGLYYYRARYYDSALKRFVSEDPLGIEAGWNVHAYVDGDPISLADPDGELPIAPILIAAGGAALLDIAIQLVFNDFEVGCIDWWQVGISAGLGGLGGWATAARGVAIAARADRAARGGVQAVRAGQAGEDAVRAVVNIGEKGKFVVNGRTRIADGITDTVVSEVKNVKTLSYTRQLRDYVDFARQTGRRFDLFVRPDGGTTLSGPLAEAIADRLINLRTIGIP